jgi:hypothetical protein
MENAEDKIKVWTAVTNIGLKILIAICILIGFFISLVFMCKADSWQDRAVFGALDGVLAYTMYPLTKHFFPALKESKQ